MFKRSLTHEFDDIDVVMSPPPPPAPISVVTLAGELDEPIGSLVNRLGDDVFVETLTGLRCVTVETCRRLVDERDRRQAERAAIVRQEREDAAKVARPARLTASDSYLDEIALRGLQTGGGR